MGTSSDPKVYCDVHSTMFLKHLFNNLNVFYIVLFIHCIAADISLDYYFGFDSSLRTHGLIGACRGDKLQQSCFKKCGPIHACILTHCYCIEKLSPKPEIILEETSYEDTASESTELYKEDYQSESNNYEESYEPETPELEKPVLRHHIAHFCPNLDDARVCIRKCMQVGKPAFCGKDHHCYCGHKNDYPGIDLRVSPKDLHNQFKDLYEKYFGPKKKSDKDKLHGEDHEIEPGTEPHEAISTTEPFLTTVSADVE